MNFGQNAFRGITTASLIIKLCFNDQFRAGRGGSEERTEKERRSVISSRLNVTSQRRPETLAGLSKYLILYADVG